jgi:hypothetical protein
MESTFDSQPTNKQPSHHTAAKKPADEASAEHRLQRYSADQNHTGFAPPIVYQVLRTAGQPLDRQTQQNMAARFQHDFSRVRVHTGERAAASAEAVRALAYTVGEHVVFDRGLYAPHTAIGRQVLAHELAHIVQQGPGPLPARLPIDPHDSPAERQAVAAVQSRHVHLGPAATALQRQGSQFAIRSPALEETATLASEFTGTLVGRPLTSGERALARPIFGASLDFDRVRLVTLDLLQYRTVGDTIYVPEGFTIQDAAMAQTLIHELTHVWQYQHTGTSYISLSLWDQIVAAASQGSRNFAYAYTISPDQSFFDFGPEQQGAIVEHYFAMLRDQREIPNHQAARLERAYDSNHLDADGFPKRLTAAQRLAEISTELPGHQRLIAQMQAAMLPTEMEALQLWATDLMQTPGADILPVSEELQIAPLKPVFEFRFPGL